MKLRLLAAAVLSLGNVAFSQPDPDYQLYLTGAAAASGCRVQIRCMLDYANGTGVTAGSWGVCASPGDDTVVVVPCEGGVPNDCVDDGLIVPGAALKANGGYACFYAPATTDGGWTVGWIHCGFLNTYIPPQDNAELVVATYELLGPPGSSADLYYCETGSPLVFIQLGTERGDVIPELAGSVIEITDGAPFIRGDVDGNGVLEGLLDPLYILNYTFATGPPPPCSEAADADGDAEMDALIDALYLLNHMFLGTAPPPPPYPDCNCDPDPRTSLGCNSPPAC